ncbi:MAG: hypothetical protein GTN70_06960 [Deltaproteobacteria bacterium]|nr:hypothetical protein [Deltaproteobacteria bacterium]NIS77435.1 hypothetical protein [Deltaproteobacteria bacterium]
MRKRKILITGVMTGTSGDGVDISLLSFSGGRNPDWAALECASYPFPRKLHEEIIRFQEKRELSKREYLRFCAAHGNFVGVKVAGFIEKRFGNRPLSNAAIAYHGQTIAHYPERERVGKGRYSFTLQAGDASVVSRITGLTVVSDFRRADVAAGGSGAPLAPPFHALLLKGVKKTSAFLNIGGIGNITIVRNGKVVTASDTGPGNMLLDGAVKFYTGGRKTFDRGGKIAMKGTPSRGLLRFIEERDGFLKKKKPASTGRETYGEKLLGKILSNARKRGLSGEDVIATLTYYTASCVARFLGEMGAHPLSCLYVGGGGAKNDALMSALAGLVPAGSVVTSRGTKVAPDFVESAAFAYLGYLCLAGIPVDTSSFTGGGKSILGRITPGTNFQSLMRYLHRR